jgi:hypothetical protein
MAISKKIIFSLFLFLGLFLAENRTVLFVEASQNSQVTSSVFLENIFYSKESVEDGDKAKIYTTISNPNPLELSGIVVFFDREVFIGKSSFKVAVNGVAIVSIDWTANSGEHIIFGRVESAKFLTSDGKYQDVYFARNQTNRRSDTIAKKIIVKTDINTNKLDPSKSEKADLKIKSENKDIVFEPKEEIKNSGNSDSIISDLGELVKEKTPDFIEKPITSSVNFLESFRKNTETNIEEKQKEVKQEISKLEEKQEMKNQVAGAVDKNFNFLKPIKSVESFLLTLSSKIFDNKPVFYGSLSVGSYFLARFMLGLFF